MVKYHQPFRQIMVIDMLIFLQIQDGYIQHHRHHHHHQHGQALILLITYEILFLSLNEIYKSIIDKINTFIKYYFNGRNIYRY